jgi:phenylpropionate dioxygenase-like ring-hydroxylating dioxygenase large terminal subunit
MIPNQWYAVLESSEVPRNRPVGVLRLGERLVFWREEDGKVACLRDICPHRGAAFSAGKLHQNLVECPFHGFRFDASGACQLVPANGSQAPFPRQIKAHSYPTYEAWGFIFIYWGDKVTDFSIPSFFEDIDSGFSYGAFRDPWKTHYSRAIENQLDVVHLPFVHTDTIGRGGRIVIDGPLVKWIGKDRFKVYVFNRPDDGRPVRKQDELTFPAEETFHLDFIFPNLWQNYLSSTARVVLAFVPVDQENSMIYLRFYQKFVRVRGIRSLVNWLSMPLNRKILHQDRRVVETQVPKRTELKMGEKLIQGDHPIIGYRKRRQELIEAAKQTITN